MKNLLLLPFVLVFCLLLACRKNQDPAPSSPCADIATDTSSLVPNWTFAGGFLRSIYPAVFDQQVVFSRYKNENETELLGFNSVSGELIWQNTVPIKHLGDRRYRQLGSKLYFTNDFGLSLCSFDVITHQLDTISILNEPGYILPNFAIQPGFAICLVRNSFSDNDSLRTSAYFIDLQNGHSRKIGQYDMFHATNLSGLFDPKVTITSTGDTVFCFVKAEYYSIGGDYIARAVMLNISTGIARTSEVLRTTYWEDQNNLVVEGDNIWWLAGNKLQSINLNTGTKRWEVVNSDFYEDRILVRQNKVFMQGTYMRAFDASSGAELWNYYITYNGEDLASSLIRDGKLYIVQGFYVRSFDLETGCLIGEHAFPPGNIALKSMAASPDERTLYLLGYDNFFAVPIPY